MASLSSMILRSEALRQVTRSMSTGGSGISHVTVIGAGLMGSGIAQVAAQAGCTVTMVDQTDELLQKAKSSLDKSLARVAKKKFMDDVKGQEAYMSDAQKQLNMTTNLSSAAKSADLVIEAIVENLNVKRQLFAQLEDSVKPGTLLATNTSSLCLKDICLNMKHQENFGGLHFFNPVPVMKLLEVIRAPGTSDATFDALVKFGKKIGKTTVACKDTPGFIVNRLLVPYMLEAVRMAERGDASIQDIDTAMKLGAGYPMGPFELSDYVGLDTTKFILDGWAESYPDEPLFKPSEMLKKMVAEGKLGRKTGEGFYKH